MALREAADVADHQPKMLNFAKRNFPEKQGTKMPLIDGGIPLFIWLIFPSQHRRFLFAIDLLCCSCDN